jgi:hypothetical protein
MFVITYGIRIYKHRDKRRGQVDETVLEGMMEGDFGLDCLTSRLLRRHDTFVLEGKIHRSSKDAIELSAAEVVTTAPKAVWAGRKRATHSHGPKRATRNLKARTRQA